MAPTSKTPQVVGIAEMATALGTKPDVLTKMRMRGEMKLKPVGTVSGRDAYDFAEAQAWAAKIGLTTVATKTVTRTTKTKAPAAAAAATTGARTRAGGGTATAGRRTGPTAGRRRSK